MLTEEQQAVIYTSKALEKGQMLKVEACAGSGKTSTLIEVAKANPDCRFLYLAFNKAVVEEANNRFPSNVKVCTTHSLAYHWFADTYGKNALRKLQGSYKVFDLKELFLGADYAELSALLLRYRNFCYSDALEAEPDVNTLFEAVKSGKLPMTHDFYLKLYQMEAEDHLAKFDYVLLDEAQDTNEVTMSIFTKNNCRRILVGDPHQSIYGFRGAINALDRVDADLSLKLTYSFRSTQRILDRANYFLGGFASDKDNFEPMKSGIDADNAPTKNLKTGEIYRTNAGIILRMEDLNPRRAKHYRLLRPASAIFGCALSILNFKNGKLDKISREFTWLKRFTNINELAEYAENCNDVEVQANIKLVETYDLHLYDLYEIAEDLAKNAEADSVLTTAHTAKGLEWDEVLLGHDFLDLAEMDYRIKNQGKSNKETRILTPEEFEQELNLYYVAVTRARYELEDHSENDVEYELHGSD